MAMSASRVMEILEAVAVAAERPNHARLSKALGIPKSSLTSLLKQLVESQFLLVDDAGTYRLGPRLLLLSNAYLRNYNPFREATPEVIHLCKTFGETVHISIADGDDILVVHQESGRFLMSTILRVGERAPALATAAGVALTAYATPEIIERRISNAKTLGWIAASEDIEQLRLEFDRIRMGGVTRLESRYIVGATGYAVPLVDPSTGTAFATISLVLPTDRVNGAKDVAIIDALKTVRAKFP